MDPNPLQYQNVDENQPLYRAGLLSAGFVAVLIVLALGINFVIHHTGSNSPSVKRNLDTSPDDTVNGMRRELAGDNSGTSTEISGSYPAAGSMAANGSRASFAPSGQGFGSNSAAAATPLIAGNFGPRAAANSQSPTQTHAMQPIHADAMRDLASLNSDNIDDLLAGR